jgi:DNA-binding MltR family transcriptional regulator
MTYREVPVEQLSKDSRRLMDVLNNESALACVVIGAAFLDAALASLLSKTLLKSGVTTKLLGPSGALGSFGTRADLAYCLSLITKSHYKDLCVIAEIRNHFAHHHLNFGFNDPKVRQLCDRLHEWKILLFKEEDTPAEAASVKPVIEQLATRARNQFNLTVVFISNRLLLTALGLKTTETSS